MLLRHPWFLLLLLVIPLMVWLRYGRNRRNAMRFSDGRILSRIPASFGVMIQPLLPICYALSLALLVVALARPQKGLEESHVKTQGIDIVLVVDVSPSMEAVDLSTATREINRLDAAKDVIDRFIEARPADRIGMVGFAAMPYSVAPLTLDHGWLVQRMRQMKPGMLGDRTAIGTALASAVNRLRDSAAKSKIVVLLTDGENNYGEISPENAAEAAKALGIKVYTVGAGQTGVVRVPVDDPIFGRRYQPMESRVDEPMLRGLAETTGGAFFRATDLASLGDIYQQIDRMEKTEIDVQQYTRFEERFMPFVLIGMVLLGLEKALALSRFGRIPS